jgi:hypothetical protein
MYRFDAPRRPVLFDRRRIDTPAFIVAMLRESAHVRVRRCASLRTMMQGVIKRCFGRVRRSLRLAFGPSQPLRFLHESKAAGGSTSSIRHARQCALVSYGASCPGCKLDRDIQARSLRVANRIVLPAIVHTVVEILMRVALAGLVGPRDATLRFSTSAIAQRCANCSIRCLRSAPRFSKARPRLFGRDRQDAQQGRPSVLDLGPRRRAANAGVARRVRTPALRARFTAGA